jgi:hypothetical protein
VLGEHRAVRVVVDEHGQAEALGHDVAERDVPDRQVDRRDRHPGGVVHERRDPEPTARTSPPAPARAAATVSTMASRTAARSVDGASRWARWCTSSRSSTAPARSFVPPRSTPITQPAGTPGHHTQSDVPDPRDVAPPPAPLQDGDKPYTKYRARPALLGRAGRDDGALLRPPGGPGPGPAPGRGAAAGLGASGPGGLVSWLLLALVGWLALSLVVFLVSATIHQDDVGGGTRPGGFPLTSPTNVLVLGSDRRTARPASPGRAGPSRADSILLLRVGGGASSRLSIPRDTVVEIPGRGRNKINAAYAFGGAALAVETVRSYLGVEVNHVVEVSFGNFPALVDAMGGIDYTGGCVVSRINGGFATAATRCACGPGPPGWTAIRRSRSRAPGRTSAGPTRATSRAPAASRSSLRP